jgi:hypothetical protein
VALHFDNVEAALAMRPCSRCDRQIDCRMPLCSTITTTMCRGYSAGANDAQPAIMGQLHSRSGH